MGKIYLQEKITPVENKYIVADEYGFLTAGDLVTELHPQLIITGININLSQVDSLKIFCNGREKTLVLKYVSDHTIICYPDEFGVWKVTVTIGNNVITEDVDVTKISTYYISLSSIEVSDEGINNDDWETIKDVVDEGTAGSYYNIGDVKEIPLEEGYFGDLYIPAGYKLYAFIIGINHNAGIEGAGITFQFGYRTEDSNDAIAFVDAAYGTRFSSDDYLFRINNDSNVNNGWENSNVRNDLLSTSSPVSLYSRLPSGENGIVSLLSPKYLYTDNYDYRPTDTPYLAEWVTRTTDYLFLLSEYEIFGVTTYSNMYEQNMQQQYAYYKTYSKKKYKHNSANIDNPEPCSYWTRSKSYYGEGFPFCLVNSNNQSSETRDCRYAEGLAPAFFIGNEQLLNANVRITGAGAIRDYRSATYSSYVMINDTAYADPGKILVHSGDIIKVYAKSATSGSRYAVIGCKFNGLEVGTRSDNYIYNRYENIYTYTVPIDFSGVINIKLLHSPTSYYTSDKVFYVEITTDESN